MTTPVSTTPAPMICTVPSDSPSHTQATAAAITGSLIATTLVAVGLR